MRGMILPWTQDGTVFGLQGHIQAVVRQVGIHGTIFYWVEVAFVGVIVGVLSVCTVNDDLFEATIEGGKRDS